MLKEKFFEIMYGEHLKKTAYEETFLSMLCILIPSKITCVIFIMASNISKKILVSIGNPLIRFEEDPVRSLRAIRFSSKLNFKISNDVKEGYISEGASARKYL